MEAYAQSVPVAAGVPKAVNPVIIGKFAEKGDLSSLIDPKPPLVSGRFRESKHRVAKGILVQN